MRQSDNPINLLAIKTRQLPCLPCVGVVFWSKNHPWSEGMSAGLLAKKISKIFQSKGISVSQSKGISENEFSFASRCLECKNRTVPDLERITIDCVVAPKS